MGKTNIMTTNYFIKFVHYLKLYSMMMKSSKVVLVTAIFGFGAEGRAGGDVPSNPKLVSVQLELGVPWSFRGVLVNDIKSLKVVPRSMEEFVVFNVMSSGYTMM